MDVSFLKKNCGAKRKGKKEVVNCFVAIALLQESEKKNNLPLFIFYFYPSILAPQFFLEMIRLQHFHNIFTTNPK